MTSRLYHSLCLTLFITGLLGDIVALGDLIRAPFGGIAENWPLKCKHNVLYLRTKSTLETHMFGNIFKRNFCAVSWGCALSNITNSECMKRIRNLNAEGTWCANHAR